MNGLQTVTSPTCVNVREISASVTDQCPHVALSGVSDARIVRSAYRRTADMPNERVEFPLITHNRRIEKFARRVGTELLLSSFNRVDGAGGADASRLAAALIAREEITR